ncbi:MAG TPA: hypothetical protein VLW05_01325 [Gaiellaceae bacterium]|nr:hypothetical protein [Gaiellaceae bacterium]
MRFAMFLRAGLGCLAVAAVVSGCGSVSRKAAPPAPRPDLTVTQVMAAFAAVGLPLTEQRRDGGFVDLGSRAYTDVRETWSVPADLRVSVQVAPATGEWLAYQVGDDHIAVRNVSVWYAPSSSWASKVRTAMARLRRA